ncbi:hypothetical protein [Devosia sp.]|uniref:hypothetical protein n=1 Tax=Devosia sp. TaxID=1871048 RepID=UPI003BA9F892
MMAHWTIRSTALVAILALAAPALAAPPLAGTTHTFVDPVFNGTVFCDTLEEVRAIATAAAPDDAYANFRLTTNDSDEPMCMAIAPTGTVVNVVEVGVMEKDGHHYKAWAIETLVGEDTAYALYLERHDFILV